MNSKKYVTKATLVVHEKRAFSEILEKKVIRKIIDAYDLDSSLNESPIKDQIEVPILNFEHNGISRDHLMKYLQILSNNISFSYEEKNDNIILTPQNNLTSLQLIRLFENKTVKPLSSLLVEPNTLIMHLNSGKIILYSKSTKKYIGLFTPNTHPYSLLKYFAQNPYKSITSNEVKNILVSTRQDGEYRSPEDLLRNTVKDIRKNMKLSYRNPDDFIRVQYKKYSINCDVLLKK